jgi:hypothetical protein
MNEQTARELLMEYLYDEISAADKKKLESYLVNHPELQQELDELRQSRTLLQGAPDVESEQKLIFAEPSERTFSGWLEDFKTVLPQSVWGRTAMAAAACLALFMVIGTIADLNIQSNRAGFSVSFGERIEKQTVGITESQTEAIVEAVQQENTAILTEYADMLNKHNSQQLQQVVEHFERQRLNDLQVVDKALSEYQQLTETQLQQTNQVLGEVIETTSFKK